MVSIDSGGLQKEAFWLRYVHHSEREDGVGGDLESGANVLVGNDKEKMVRKARGCLATEDLETKLNELLNPFGDGNASTKTSKALREIR
jgi:UDP-N-acetylglucosamine 2-epimerase